MPGYSGRELQLFPAPRRAWERLSGQNPELPQGHDLGFCFCESQTDYEFITHGILMQN